jgi:hypothetical protein
VDATKGEGKSTTKASGAVKEKPRKHKILLLGDSQVTGLVVRVPGYRSRDPGFDSWGYQIL